MKGGNSLYLALILFFTAIGGAWAIGPSKDSTKSDYALANGTAAVYRALEYTGFDKLKYFSEVGIVNPELVINKDDKSPFLSSLIDNIKVWKVTFKNVRMVTKLQESKRDFTILLDPQTGKLLQIKSVSNYGSSDIASEPPANAAENYLRDMNIEFHGLPEKILMDFTDALAQCPRSVARTNIVTAYYVNHTSPHNKVPEPAWIIIMRGIEPPVFMHGPDADKIPIAQRNAILCAINALTGKRMYYTRAPLGSGE
jgi:hypothetical protein